MGAMIVGWIYGVIIHALSQPDVIYVERAEAHEPPPKEVRIEVIYNWDTDRIKEEIRKTFPEAPGIAVQIARCESDFRMIQSYHQQPYGRERSFGIFQIHEPDWHSTAMKLGLDNYQTDIRQNLEMARYIYDTTGGWHPWSCYRLI